MSNLEALSRGPAFALPPSYKRSGKLDIEKTKEYISYLQKNGAKTIMTTAGTSQYNLLKPEEIRELSRCLYDNFSHTKIIGLPALSLQDLKEEVEYWNRELKENKDTFLMALYPERYYDDKTIFQYFHKAADLSKFPMLFHGMFMRKGTGGSYDYTAELINKIAEHKNIFGMKEETSDLGLAFGVCNKIDKTDFCVIVAGGSIRRFNFLQTTGVQSFVSGLGSMFPKQEIKYFKTRSPYFLHLETKLFDVFMSIGWHKAMREALRQMGFCDYNRQPFPSATKLESQKIKEVLETIDQ